MQATPGKPGPEVSVRGNVEERGAVALRFAGDASDGMQLIGELLANISGQQGNCIATLVDPPAEIRAPTGTLPGVHACQVLISNRTDYTPSDYLNVLVAMTPAAMKIHLADLEPGGILIVNVDGFTREELDKAGYAVNPLSDGSLRGYRLLAVPMSIFNREAIARHNLIPREVARCRNFFPLGLVCWLLDRPLEAPLRWIRATYARNPAMIEASTSALEAGHRCGEKCGLPIRYCVGKAPLPAGRFRMLTAIESMALGVLAAVHQTDLPCVFAGFPVAPASELLHRLMDWKQSGIKVIQAEDDQAALNLVIGAAFGGALGITATTGSGLALQAEALALAVMCELPCVVIDFQRAGPSTGMPGKTEQADLLAALWGRTGECPLVVLAPATPADGFQIILEAVRLAVRAMAPVIVLADVSLAQSAETWRVPSLPELPRIDVPRITASEVAMGIGAFHAYQRDARGARPWAIPGTAGLEHRISGMEKEDGSGIVSFDPANHERMVRARADKIARLAAEIPPMEVRGPSQGDLLVLGWGSTAGTIQAAVERCQRRGLQIACAHLRHLHPLPSNTGAVLRRYRQVLIPELNAGQLARVLRAEFLVDALSLTKIQGEPLRVSEVEQKIEELLSRQHTP